MAISVDNYLVITALGSNQADLVYKFTKMIADCSCNILNTRMTGMEAEFAMILLVSGNWSGIAKLEAAIPAIERELNITTSIRRTSAKTHSHQSMIYVVHVITIDRSSILLNLANFLFQQGIDIEDINSYTYQAKNGTRMADITMHINISLYTNIPNLREKFMVLCDSLNIDAGMEPLRE